MSDVTVKAGKWMELFEEHPRCVDVLYASMPNQETSSLVMREYRIGGSQRESPNLHFPKDHQEITL